MGSGNSKQKAIAEEFNKPTDISDIDTPRGESAKNEVKRLRALLDEHREVESLLSKALMGDTPSLETYLKKIFKQHDVDESGTLSWEEFKKLLNSLELGLTEEEIEKLREVSDTDLDGTISPEEFAKSAPTYLRKVYDGLEVTEHVWSCLTDAGGNIYYYNKQTGESTWDCPEGYQGNTEPASTNSALTPEWKSYLVRVFKEADVNDSKKLSRGEFQELVNGKLGLGFSDEKFTELLKKLDTDDDAEVDWEEFVAHAPELVMGINQGSSADDCWVTASDESGNTYYYNSKTGETSWEAPATAASGDQALPPESTVDGEQAEGEADGEKAEGGADGEKAEGGADGEKAEGEADSGKAEGEADSEKAEGEADSERAEGEADSEKAES